jgi:glycosyltransferase involved in cell wall biosynthesis
VPARPLLVVSQSLGAGGAERVITILLRHLDRDRFRPSLALFDVAGPFLADVPPDVPVHAVTDGRAGNPVAVAAGLRRIVRSTRPSVILSVLKHANLMTLVAACAWFPDIPVVISERNVLSLVLGGDRGRHLKRWLHRRLYPRARTIIAISSGVKEDLQQSFAIPGDRIRVIHNPCEIERVRRLAGARPDVPIDWSIPTVVAAGRLTAQKGFGDLLEAFAGVARRRTAQLLILGEGERRRTLAEQAARLGVSDRVLMPGFDPNPFAYMARGSVFVLSSLSEGFGNVIVEAMACGIPVVSANCRSGPGEIIEHGRSGLLVPPADAEALAAAIEQVLAQPALAVRLAEGGRARVNAFSHEKILERYEDTLLEAASSQRTPFVRARSA